MSKHRKHEGRVLSSKEVKIKKASEKLSKQLRDKINPFEKIKQKRKFDYIGAKQQIKQLSKSRSAGVQQRKETLLHDFYNREKANEFIDERDDQQPLMEKAREKIKRAMG